MIAIGRHGQWPLFGYRTGLVERAVAIEVRPVAAHERRHRLGPRQREVSRQPPEAPPEPGSDPGLAGGEPIEHQAPPLVLVALHDAFDGLLRNDGVRVDEAEHPPGAGRDAGVACRGAGPADARHQSHTDVICERCNDRCSGVLAPVVRHDDLEGGFRKPEILAGDARSSDHTRDNGLEDFADQRLLVARGDHEGETSFTHSRLPAGGWAPTSSRRPPGRRQVAGLAPTASECADRRQSRPAEVPDRCRSAGYSW